MKQPTIRTSIRTVKKLQKIRRAHQKNHRWISECKIITLHWLSHNVGEILSVPHWEISGVWNIGRLGFGVGWVGTSAGNNSIESSLPKVQKLSDFCSLEISCKSMRLSLSHTHTCTHTAWWLEALELLLVFVAASEVMSKVTILEGAVRFWSYLA